MPDAMLSATIIEITKIERWSGVESKSVVRNMRGASMGSMGSTYVIPSSLSRNQVFVEEMTYVYQS